MQSTRQTVISKWNSICQQQTDSTQLVGRNILAYYTRYYKPIIFDINNDQNGNWSNTAGFYYVLFIAVQHNRSLYCGKILQLTMCSSVKYPNIRSFLHDICELFKCRSHQQVANARLMAFINCSELPDSVSCSIS